MAKIGTVIWIILKAFVNLVAFLFVVTVIQKMTGDGMSETMLTLCALSATLYFLYNIVKAVRFAFKRTQQ